MFSMESFADEMVKIAVAKHSGLLDPVMGAVGGMRRFAIANPKVLPYGGAALLGMGAYKGGERLYENQQMAEAMRERMAAARGA